MPHETTNKTRPWVAAALMTPTAVVVAVWIASAFPGGRPGGPPPAGWSWVLVPNYLRFERTSPPVPAAALPAGTVPAGWGPPYNGFMFRGDGSYFFGWVQVSRGHYFRGTRATPSLVVRVSLVIPLILTLPLAWAAVRLWARPSLQQRRRSAGLCPACGYDTRATPGRCPECGTEDLGRV